MDDLLHHFDEHIRVLRVLRRLVASSDPLAIRTAFAIIASELATDEPPSLRSTDALRAARYRQRQRDAQRDADRDDARDVGVTTSVTERDENRDATVTLDNVVPVVQSLELLEKPRLLEQETSPKNLQEQKELRIHALEILRFLNEKTGRNYREKDTNLRLIQARLRDGASVQDCKAVIARKWREWRDDPVMNKYCRPATLFGALKFEQYVGEKERPQ